MENSLHIISKLSMTENGLIVKGTKQSVHLQQGSLDGACAVYSMMMGLIIIRTVKYNDITNPKYKPKGQTSKGRLVHHFFNEKGFVREGYSLDSLNCELKTTFKEEVETAYFSEKNDKKNFYEDIISSIEEDTPVELAFGRREWGHAVLCVGYRQDAEKIDFYCLDPGYPIETGQYWNNILIVDTESDKKLNCYNLMEETKVSIEEALVFRKQNKNKERLPINQ